jgi:hypothetical protein
MDLPVLDSQSYIKNTCPVEIRAIFQIPLNNEAIKALIY